MKSYKFRNRQKLPLLFFTAILIFALSGCQVKSAVNPNAKNGNGSFAINIKDNPAPPSPSDDLTNNSSDPTGSYPVSSDSPDYTPTPPQNVADDSGVIEIREKLFVSQINDIYYNAADYLGKTFSYEGIFFEYTSTGTDTTYRSVIRYGPGCCGTDSNCGFEIVWDGAMPREGDWVRVTGVLEKYEENGWDYLQLRLSSMNVLDVRGAEYVSQ